MTSLVSIAIGLVLAGDALAQKPRIAVFSGPTATIHNSGAPLITSNKARLENGLPLVNGPDGRPLKYDRLYMQRIAAPVTIYVEQFTAHPLEADAAELYAPPDGYIGLDGSFSEERRSPSDKPVYEMTLRPEDGLYPLPYMALQEDGTPWDDAAAYPGAPFEKTRQMFYPDASRIFEEIERNGGQIYGLADFDFYRAAPPGGYTKGLPAALRTDVGSGDIPPEERGIDFFRYGTHRADAPRGRLATATMIVQRAFDTGQYAGAMWLEGSPNVEESSYWLNLLIDTTKPIVVHSAQRARTYISADGDRNIVDGVNFILSNRWAGEDGANELGGVLLVDQVVYSAREVQKGDARPGGYVATGGFGGILGTVGYETTITNVPNGRKHTYTSEVNVNKLPYEVLGLSLEGDKVVQVSVPVKNAYGELQASAIPSVSIVKASRWRDRDALATHEDEVEIHARIAENLRSEPLAGFIQEGVTGGGLTGPVEAALEFAAAHGFPVVRVNRGNPMGFVRTSEDNLYIDGRNLTSTKARLLLMASLMKLGSLPPAADPANPTEAELAAIHSKIAEYQEIFDTH